MTAPVKPIVMIMFANSAAIRSPLAVRVTRFVAMLLLVGNGIAGAGLAAAEDAVPPIVPVSWLQERLCDDRLVVLDVRRAAIDFEAAHIPCAVYTNFYEDGWREMRGPLPLMMPPADRLAALIGSLGIDNQSHVVIYASGTGPFDLAETTSIYFTFRYLGHGKVSILDGGLPAWTAEWDNDIDVGPQAVTAQEFAASPQPDMLIETQAVAEIVAAHGTGGAASGPVLVDLRRHDMYLGINRAPVLVRYGTLPGAFNLPMTWVTRDDSLYFRSPAALAYLLGAAGVPDDRPLVMFCNSGLESSVGWFVAHAVLGRAPVRLYDGSLAAWSRNPALPMARKLVVPDNGSPLP